MCCVVLLVLLSLFSQVGKWLVGLQFPHTIFLFLTFNFMSFFFLLRSRLIYNWRAESSIFPRNLYFLHISLHSFLRCCFVLCSSCVRFFVFLRSRLINNWRAESSIFAHSLSHFSSHSPSRARCMLHRAVFLVLGMTAVLLCWLCSRCVRKLHFPASFSWSPFFHFFSSPRPPLVVFICVLSFIFRRWVIWADFSLFGRYGLVFLSMCVLVVMFGPLPAVCLCTCVCLPLSWVCLLCVAARWKLD